MHKISYKNSHIQIISIKIKIVNYASFHIFGTNAYKLFLKREEKYFNIHSIAEFVLCQKLSYPHKLYLY